MTRVDDVTTSHQDVGRVPRRRGAVNGFLVVLLGLWGAAVPLFGPYLGLAYGTDSPWVFSSSWLLLSLLPGLAVVLGGLGLISTVRSTSGVFAGWLAAVGGAWFIVGQPVSTLWNGGEPAAGAPVATSTAGQVVTEMVFFTGLGALIVFLAAVALGRFTAGTGRTVVTAVPEQDRGDHGTLDGRHRADSTDDLRTDAFPAQNPTGDQARHGAYAAGAHDETRRPDTTADGLYEHQAPDHRAPDHRTAENRAPENQAPAPEHRVRDDRTEAPAEQTQAMGRRPVDRR